ncbi:TonB-dependent Receptor Plug Domain protein [Mariniflexile rhizosphaerae]|uniref:TonB-dependent receptor n=1 Tax=unclassified Mariniflexile TaxID=2643887 RepID=UPI000CAAF4C8|nr:TonB-dependent receptor [Mariniflexile sp. TRM1-10]AXP80950.1 TonB-dependent Receptor Plug Domain protein [Mariniflexile sp. TRM1-10]PLB19973.1 MAG: TonB-dependent receptor [Flavobacteriaceae bacterium FS1-H7996/R]
MKKLTLLLLLFTATISYSQNTGSVVGKLTDKEYNNEPLAFANVLIKGTTKGTTSDFDGLYSIENLRPGAYTFIFSFVGYETQQIPVTVLANKVTEVNVPMGASAASLSEVVITTTTKRESETALLLEQKKAVAFKASIGADELSRKGVSDVATAVTKVSGISKQEGSGNIFVRGLGDRYNITTLNGLPLPSNNPSNKNIVLDIFTTDIVEYVGISKTFESQNYADFGGANIDIVSKKFSGSPYVILGVGLGANTNVLKVDDFYLQDGPSYLGFDSGKAPSNPLLPYNYATSWDRQSTKNIFNNSYALSGGKKFSIGNESSLSTFITASFDAENKYIEGFDRGSITAQGTINSDFYKKSYKHNTNTTVMGSADYKINNQNAVLFTSLFLNSSSQDYSEYEGTNQNFDGGAPGVGDISGFIKRGTFDKTQLFVNQLLGSHEFNEQWQANWAVGYSILNNVIPDRMQNTFVPARDGSSNYTFFTDSSIHNHRYFQELEENELSANASVSYNFNKNVDDEFNGKVTLGYSGKMKDIDFDSQQYGFFPVANKITFPANGIHDVDTYLNSSNFNTSTGDRSSVIPQLYTGNLDVHAVYGTLQYNVTEKLSAIVGVRFEQLEQNVYFETSLVPSGDNSNYSPVNFLPSLTAKYKLNDNQNLKFAASKTYTLPQFKEKVKLLFQEVTQDYEGNPNLYASTNYNADLGWEYFPSNGELVSVTAFGKLIQNPINEMFTNSSSGNITYANTGERAIALGVELELRKNIFEIEKENDLKDKLSFGINGSYINHTQDLDKDKVFEENGFGANFTFDEAKLSGASDVLANADITLLKEFANNKDISATLSYAYFSDKLAVIGTQSKGNMVDKSINRLDFNLKSSLTKNLKLGVSYKNILDPTYKRILEQSKVPGSTTSDVLVSSYKIGSNFKISLEYKF